MHELTLCYHLINTIEQSFQAQPQSNAVISRVFIEVGELAGIECSALEFSFPIAAKNSVAKDAQLNINHIPGKAWCQKCMKNVTLHHLFDACDGCGDYQYQIIQGKEFKLIKLEMS